jgi:hypothetical protein
MCGLFHSLYLHVQTPNQQLRWLSVTFGPVPGHNT